MSGDPEQEYFADGMVEDIITGLSRIKWLFVIARNSSFAYTGKSPDIRQIGRDLGVRYVLEGSVRKLGNRVRITAQLLEAETGVHIWVERYDRTLDDICASGRDHEQRSAAWSPVYMRRAHQLQRKPPQSLDAWECFIRHLPLPAPMKIAAPRFRSIINLDRVWPSIWTKGVHPHLARVPRLGRNGLGDRTGNDRGDARDCLSFPGAMGLHGPGVRGYRHAG
jgi:TolB-like protein